jgi:hypothetical protein
MVKVAGKVSWWRRVEEEAAKGEPSFDGVGIGLGKEAQGVARVKNDRARGCGVSKKEIKGGTGEPAGVGHARVGSALGLGSLEEVIGLEGGGLASAIVPDDGDCTEGDLVDGVDTGGIEGIGAEGAERFEGESGGADGERELGGVEGETAPGLEEA